MIILAVDDERLLLYALKRELEKACPYAEIYSNTSALNSIDFARKNVVDIAFLDIEMPMLNGIELAKTLKEINPKTNIIFVTGYSEYMKSAFDIYASGYISKPVNEYKIMEELLNLRYMFKDVKEHDIKVKTFGNFDIFVDGELVVFPRAISKEILAFLIDKQGKCCSLNEIAENLGLTDLSGIDNNHVSVSISTMMLTLKEYNIDYIIDKKFNSYAIKTNLVDCDYYNYKECNPKAIFSYTGQYMSTYLWADYTNEILKKNILQRK
jgi:two-component SAPR family response regulator